MKKIACTLVILASMSAFAQLPSIPADEKELAKVCTDALTAANARFDQIAKNKNEATFENTLVAIDDAVADLDSRTELPLFLLDVSPSAAVRDAAAVCRQQVRKFGFDAYGREDVFIRVQAVRNSSKGRKLVGEDKKLLEDTYNTFIMNGLGNDNAEVRKQIKEFSNQVSDLEIQFMKNLSDGKKFIQVSKDELIGMSDTYISGLKKADNGKYIITTAYPDYIPFMENAKNENARKRLYEQFSTLGGKANVEILEKTLALREKIAKLMGFNSHADRILTVGGKMATSVKEVRTFLDDLVARLKPYYDKDLSELKRLKCKETRCKDWDKIYLNPWETAYYSNKVKQNVLGKFDLQTVREYFPFETVTRGIFQIYQKLLGIDFDQMKNVPVWDPLVEVYAVRDHASHDVLGYFYLDMFPRDGKYTHAAVQGMTKSKYLGGGKYMKPTAAMECNFTKSTPTAPSLLDHDEVETFFHEFGHLMDNILSKSKYYVHGNGDALYSPRMVGRPGDFVEALSQMLENWVWNPESLALLSSHYKTGEKLPKEALDKLIELKNVNNGLRNTGQLFFASMDMDYHTLPQPSDTTKAWKDRAAVMMSGIKPATFSYPQANFSHIMDGFSHEAGYYGYMWSKVYAEDMYSIFEKNGVLNPRTGMAYRKLVLEPASGQETMVSLKNFLGREPNSDAFIKSLGIEEAKPSK